MPETGPRKTVCTPVSFEKSRTNERDLVVRYRDSLQISTRFCPVPLAKNVFAYRRSFSYYVGTRCAQHVLQVPENTTE